MQGDKKKRGRQFYFINKKFSKKQLKGKKNKKMTTISVLQKHPLELLYLRYKNYLIMLLELIYKRNGHNLFKI